MTVAFFGHGNTPSEVYPLLERKIAELAEQNEDITFLVGTHGAFDGMSRRALKQAAERYPHIKCFVVLAYYEPNGEDYGLPTLFPEGIESRPKRYAINYRNDYMVRECDAVICYITHDWGGAWQFVHKADKHGKQILNLAQ